MPHLMWYLDPSNDDAKASSASDEVMINLAFKNRSSWPVLLLWCDYRAERVLYCKISPSATYNIMSFATHPWIAIDYYSYHRMSIGSSDVNKRYCFVASFEDPENMEQNEYKDVYIDTPLLRLEDLCIRFVKNHFSQQEIGKFDIPQVLIDYLVREQSKPWSRCITSRPVNPNQ